MQQALVVCHFEEPDSKCFKTPSLPDLLSLNQLLFTQKRETLLKDDSLSTCFFILWLCSLIFHLDFKSLKFASDILRNLQRDALISMQPLEKQTGELCAVKGLTLKGCLPNIQQSSASLGYFSSSELYIRQSPLSATLPAFST